MGPVVAVLAGRAPVERISLHAGYIEALSFLGATPIVVPPLVERDHDRIERLLGWVDAVLVTGGGDVEPHHYRDDPLAELMDVDPVRDESEICVIQAAVQRKLRVLGICRGAQVLAVAMGGALHQDLALAGFDPEHWDEENQYRSVHEIEPAARSCTDAVLRGLRRVNSIHHQAIRDPGPFLTASGWSADGVIEAVEGDLLLGVQWHPERLLAEDPRHLGPFQWLVGNEPTHAR
jgi:putative glutamine amidotransferase